jgi:hypothetical protein
MDLAKPNRTAANPMRAALDLLDQGVCVWCEAGPAGLSSYLCDSCRAQDPEGVMRKPAQRVEVSAGDTAA